MTNLPIRVVGLQFVPASELEPHPHNWRRHPEHQRSALTTMLEQIGIAGAVIARRVDGRWQILDGHLRAEILGDHLVPVLEVDLTDEETERFIATYDPLAVLAAADRAALKTLLVSQHGHSDQLDDVLARIAQVYRVAFPKRVDSADATSLQRAVSLEDLAPSDDELAQLDGKHLLIQFSGGIDSTAAAIWVKRYTPHLSAELVYIELGADFPGLELHVHRVAEWLGMDLRVLRSPESVIELMVRTGYWPHHSQPYCQDLLGKTFASYAQQWSKSELIVIRGGRWQERRTQKWRGKRRVSRFRELYIPQGYISFEPLAFADKDTSGRIVTECSAPVWDGYATGLCRTACRICPGQRPQTYAAIRRHWPAVWAELCELERRLGPGAWQPGHNVTFATLADKADAASDDADKGSDDSATTGCAA